MKQHIETIEQIIFELDLLLNEDLTKGKEDMAIRALNSAESLKAQILELIKMN